MKRAGGVLVLLAALGGCQSMHEGQDMQCPYCGARFDPYTSAVETAQTPGRPTTYAAAHRKPRNTTQPVALCAHEVVQESAPAPEPVKGSYVTGPVVTSTTTARQLEQARYATNRPEGEGPELTAGLMDVPEGKEEKKDAKSAGTPGPFPLTATDPAAAGAGSAVHFFNTKRIVLHYEVKDAGATGVPGMDLWYTHDTQKWVKVDLPGQTHSPYTLDVTKEGRYGFTLAARGSGKPGPRPGEQPQIWTEVDMTAPAVKLARVEKTAGSDGKHLVLYWKAGDKNLAAKPITLSYAEGPNGPWKQIAASVENTGRYDWKMPHGLPDRFLVKVEAADLAGNVGADQTPRALLVEAPAPAAAQPTIAIVGVEGGRKFDK